MRGFGCRAIPIDGHDLGEIDKAFAQAVDADRPTVILARTLKGRGFSEIEDREGWHGKPLPAEMAERALVELGGERHLTVRGPRPEGGSVRTRSSGEVTLPGYELGAKVATRKAFGESLAAIGARSDVVALDGEVDNSTHAEDFAKAHPGRYFEMFIAEQQLVAAAVGLSVRGYVPFAATFAAFFTRAYDFIRMAGISQVNIRLCGSHAGVEIRRGRPVADGSGRSRDDAGRARVHGPVPERRNEHSLAGAEMVERSGIVYMRTTRGAYPVLYGPDETFPIGGAKVVRSSPDDRVTLVGAGVTLHNCLAAADQLGSDGIAARVVDLYSVKPIDTETLVAAAAATGDRLVVVEDHYPAGGIGSAVLEALNDAGHPARIVHLAVRGLPGSGTPEELMDAAGISTGHVAQAAREVLQA